MENFAIFLEFAVDLWANHSLATTIGGTATLAAYVLSIRVGPGRAISLALRSRLFRRANPMTARTEELQRLHNTLALKHQDEYVVVTGPRGVGKAVFVRSATATWGVVDVDVAPGTLDKDIMEDAYSAIVNPVIGFSFMKRRRQALRVRWLPFDTSATDYRRSFAGTNAR